VRVDGGWGDHLGGAVVGEPDVPVGVVDEVMVEAAQQDAVGEVGVPVLGGLAVQVVGFAPGRR